MKEFIIELAMGIAIVLVLILVGAIIGFALFKMGLFADVKRETNTKQRLGRMLAIALGFAYIIEACAKVNHFAPMVKKWDQFAMTYLLTYVGITEIVLGILLLFPKFYKLSVLLLTAVAGGAIATHLPLHADGFAGSVPSATLLAFVWLSAVLYTPELFPDFISKRFHKQE
jgi:hypothetical protein